MPDGCKGSPPDNVKRRQIAAFSMCMDVSSLSPRDYVPFFILRGEGRIIYDVAGEEKKNLQVEDLLKKFGEASGGEFANDRMMLAK